MLNRFALKLEFIFIIAIQTQHNFEINIYAQRGHRT